MAKAKGDVVITLGAKASAGMKNAFRLAKKNLNQVKALGKQAFAFGKFAAIGGVALAGSLTAIIAKSTATGDALDKMSSRTGLSAEFLANLSHAANQGGTAIGAIEKGIKKLQVSALDASRGLKTYTREFDTLGVSVTDNKGDLKDTETLFLETVEAIAKLDDKTKKAAIASKLFGRSGTELLPMLKSGKAGILAMMQESRELGNVWNDQTAKSAADLTDSVGRMWLVIGNLGDRLSIQLIPTVQKISDGMVVWFKANQQLINVKVAEWAGKIKTGFDITIQTIRDWSNDGTFILWWERVKLAALGFQVVLDGVRSSYDFLIAGILRYRELQRDTDALTFARGSAGERENLLKSAKFREQRIALTNRATERSQGTVREFKKAAQRVAFLTQERDARNRMIQDARKRGAESGADDADAVNFAMDARTEALRKRLRQDGLAARAAQVVEVF